MKPYYQQDGIQIFHADARQALQSLPSESVHCCVTSPPYWGLRDYGLEPVVWGGPPSWRGCLGLEPTPQLYVEHMVEVFREVRRVLRDDAVVFLNLGDSYCSGGRDSYGWFSEDSKQATHTAIKNTPRPAMPVGLKPKDLVGIPWRVAFALQADGWYLRSEIIWSKPNPMPESVRDRPTKAHEQIFLLAKSERYFFNQEAVREPQQDPFARYPRPRSNGKYDGAGLGNRSGDTRMLVDQDGDPLGRNVRSVWTIATQPYPEAHFATFPEEIAKRCILAGCPEGGTVLDPFAGSGTVGQVAESLQCGAVLIEAQAAYIALIAKRLAQGVLAFDPPQESICLQPSLGYNGR